MAGIKHRSGDIPKSHKRWRMTVEDRALLILQRILRDKDIDPLDKAKVALPIYLKTMTEKRAVVELSASMSLTSEQTDKLIELAKRNSLIYKDLEADAKRDTDSTSDNVDSGVGEGV